MIWGKLLGGVFGAMIGGPLGAVVGAALGHQVDKGIESAALPSPEGWDEEPMAPGDVERVRMSFFSAAFSVMGHVAKADGRVHPSEIELAENVMDSMSLTPELREAAIKLFTEGKGADFDLRPIVLQFRKECQRRSNLYRLFMEIQIQAALADGVIRKEEHEVLLTIADVLGFPQFIFDQLVTLVSASMGIPPEEAYEEVSRAGGNGASAGAGRAGGDSSTEQRYSRQRRQHRGTASVNQGISVRDAERILAVGPGDDMKTVKRAYRRLMSQHHPDKLIAKGLPEEMIKVATDKTQNIRRAYEKIKESRG